MLIIGDVDYNWRALYRVWLYMGIHGTTRAAVSRSADPPLGIVLWHVFGLN